MTSLAPDYDRSPIPRYLQVAAAIRRRIEDGHWQAKAKISTLAELEKEFRVARVTVRQAIELLEREGLLTRIQGKGTFVAPTIEDKRWLQLDLKWSSLGRAIGANVPRFLPVPAVPPPPPLKPEDGRSAKSYRYLESVQSRRQQPYSFARVHVAEDVVAMDAERFDREPTLAVLATMPALDIKSARQTFVIAAADTVTADHLKVGLGFPTVEAHAVVTAGDNRVIYVADVVYRGDCVRLDIDLLD